MVIIRFKGTYKDSSLNGNPAEENVIHPVPILGKVVFYEKVFVEVIVKYTKMAKVPLQLHGKMEERYVDLSICVGLFP